MFITISMIPTMSGTIHCAKETIGDTILFMSFPKVELLIV
jgi:hypothetical protein